MNDDDISHTSSPQTWRQWLGKILENIQERGRIAKALNVTNTTLYRWVNGTSNPRTHYLYRLLEILPDKREKLLTLLEKEFPGVTKAVQEIPASSLALMEEERIPSEFYDAVMRARALTPKTLRFSSLCRLIEQQIMRQLDPERVGLSVIIALCLPSLDGQLVRSLREVMGQGSPPWAYDLDAQAVLLGAESLAGYALSKGRLVVKQDLESLNDFMPGYSGPLEKSAVAAPIMLADEFAGSLLVASTQTNYFLPFRCRLVENYADLLAVTLNQEDFYPRGSIQLAFLPPYVEQQKYFSWVSRKRMEIMSDALMKRAPITIVEADKRAWQKLEELLLS